MASLGEGGKGKFGRGRAVVAGGVFALFAVAPAVASGEELPYAETEWRTVYQGPENSDFVPTDAGRGFPTKWTAIEELNIITAPTIGELIDGVIDGGDFAVDLDAHSGQPAISGTATIGTATVIADVRRTGNHYTGKITVVDPEQGLEATIFVKDAEPALGPRAARGTSKAHVRMNGGKKQRVVIDWVIKNWS